MPPGLVVAVSVGPARPLDEGHRVVSSAIVKRPVTDRVAIADDQVAGDEQADRDNHGGPWQAVYAYAVEDTAWWVDELGRDDLDPGVWGENLTVRGVDVSGAVVGARWRAGSAILRVTGPRIPCHKLAARMGDPRFAVRFAEANRPGAYLAIEQPGEVAAGDAVEVLDVPDHGVTVAEVAAVHHRLGDPDAATQRAQLERLLAVPDMHPSAVALANARLPNLA